MKWKKQKTWEFNFQGLISVLYGLYHSALLLSAFKKISYSISVTQESKPIFVHSLVCWPAWPLRTFVFLFMETIGTQRWANQWSVSQMSEKRAEVKSLVKSFGPFLLTLVLTVPFKRRKYSSLWQRYKAHAAFTKFIKLEMRQMINLRM